MKKSIAIIGEGADGVVLFRLFARDMPLPFPSGT